MEAMNKKNIKRTVSALAILAVLTVFSACTNVDNALYWSDVYGISGKGVVDHKVTIYLGETLQLTATPADKTYDWTSDNEAVATVDANGLVTAVGSGEALIRVYPKNFEGAANGNYVVVTVRENTLTVVDDQIDQSEAE